METAIFNTIYMNHVLPQILGQYKKLKNDEKITFLERINQRRKEGLSVCDDCPYKNDNLGSMCNLCDILYFNFNSKLDNEINFLKYDR